MYKKQRKFWRIEGKRTINGRPVKSTDPGAIQDKEAEFLGYFVKINGKEKYLGKTPGQARVIQTRLQSQNLEAKRGVPNYLIYHQKGVDELIKEYFLFAKLGNEPAKSKSKKHINRAKLVFNTVITGTGWLILKDLSSQGLVKVINEKLAQEDPENRATRFGKKSANHWLGYWISFGKWLEKRNYVLKNPFSDIKKFSNDELEEDRRLVRRPFMAEELLALFEFTHTLKVRLRLTGEDRAMLYKLAAITGFRAGELASLTPEMFSLEGPVPTVRLAGKNAKNGKTVQQVILSGFVGEFQEYLAKKPKGIPVWDIASPTHKTKLVRVLRRDFADIKEKYPEFAVGLFDTDSLAQIDFHALRTTFNTMLAESVNPTVLTKIARHSDVRTTYKYYVMFGDPFLKDELERALSGKICSNFFTPGQGNRKELNEPKIDRAIQLMQKFLQSLNPYEYSLFAKKVRLITPAKKAAG